MSGFFATLIVIAMAAVLASLGVGVFGMAKGGDFNKKYGNKLMRARVILQGVALIFFVLAIISSQK